VSSGPTSFHDTGVFVVYAGVDPKRTSAALRAILTELARLCDEPVSAEELERAKEYTKGRLALGLENTSSVANWLGGQEIALGRVRLLDEVMERIDAVTIADIQRLARALFAEAGLRLAVIGPQKSAAELERLLHF
jgi:predicted Zn-dependent peptidase